MENYMKKSYIPEIFIGVDPGASGAIAVLSPEFIPLAVLDYDRETCSNHVRELVNKPSLAFVEHVHAMPKNGAVSMFNFGANFGWWKGLLDGCKIPYILVDPKRWQNHFGLVKKTSTDKPSLDLCRRCFPTVDLHLKKHNGRSDALCIASFGIDWYKAFIEAGGDTNKLPIAA